VSQVQGIKQRGMPLTGKAIRRFHFQATIQQGE
jgi:hypothetical protein